MEPSTSHTSFGPSKLANTYDCYGEEKIQVSPEELNFIASKKMYWNFGSKISKFKYKTNRCRQSK